MSRIGKKPIPIPEGVEIRQQGDHIYVKGPKGELGRKIGDRVHIHIENNEINVRVDNNGDKAADGFHGLFRSLIDNMVTGVTRGFEKNLEIVGVGYRAELSGRKAIFHLGYSHPIDFDLPEGIDAKIEKNKVTLMGIDKELLGLTAAKIRGFRRPEPYKGKGIKYVEETIRRKAGKTGA
jgi:large subunit ribosomal protein L6